MAVRFQAYLRYTIGSGYAQWLYDQMQVRMGMAFHLREGTPNAERSHATRYIVSSGPPENRLEDIHIDVFWPGDREDLAQDTVNTINATIPWMRADEDTDTSWMNWHYCNHNLTHWQPCPQYEWSWTHG